MKKIIRNLEVEFKYFIWAFKKSFEASEGYSVVYLGVEYWIKYAMCGEGKYHLIDKTSKEIIHRYIDVRNLKVIITFKSWKRHFKSMLQFQEQSWGMIDKRKPIGRRISYFNSDNILFD